MQEPANHDRDRTQFPSPTPREDSMILPAEWDPHEATWLAWPHNKDDWPGKLAPVHWVYGELIRKITPHEDVYLLVSGESQQAKARSVLTRCGVDLGRVRFFDIPLDRSWTRDFGPITLVARRGQGTPPAPRAVVDFHFNGWAKYDNYQHDARVSAYAANELELPIYDAHVNGRPLVLEGGAIDVNGRGTAITTVECLLDQAVQVRNPGLTREQMEAAMAEYLSVRNVVWLGKGIAGDDTHGHVDDVCRFVNPTTVVLAQETDPNDPNYKVLQENRDCLEGMRLESGEKLEVVPLPMPQPVVFDGVRLPASYANFYVTNGSVLVPTFNDPADREALGVLSAVFPGREVVGIHAVDLVWGLGTIHCLTQQLPR